MKRWERKKNIAEGNKKAEEDIKGLKGDIDSKGNTNKRMWGKEDQS